jgi:hypothetical protein
LALFFSKPPQNVERIIDTSCERSTLKLDFFAF